MVRSFLASDPSWVLFVLRVALGVVIFPHGMQKLAGWWGGNGYKATVKGFQERLHVPASLTALVIAGESLGSLLLVLGLFTRFDALAFVVTQLGAIRMSHWKNGYFVNKGGYEFNLLLVIVAALVTCYGGGALSLDAWLLGMLG
jgi:putative oxidoreductase